MSWTKINNLPILGVCGHSGSGKTSLLEQIIPALLEKGLKVAVIKHGAHRIEVDKTGKDSDRCFRAGADVLLQGTMEGFWRRHQDDSANWTDAVASLVQHYDLVLVEGHRDTPLPKVWLLSDKRSEPPVQTENVIAVLDGRCDRPAMMLKLLEEFLNEQWLKTKMFGCVLIGSASRRMGKAKHLLVGDGETLLERTIGCLERVGCEMVVILGSGEVPDKLKSYGRIADVADACGPMSGILAAMRWEPCASWLVAACDLPQLSSQALEWLLSNRHPGVWATLGRLENSVGVEPLLGHYDFRCREVLEELAGRGDFRMSDVASHRKVKVLAVPGHLSKAWLNANEPGDFPQSD